jgi:phospholipase C
MQQGPYVGHFIEAFIDDYPDSEYEARMHVMRYFRMGDLPAMHTLAQHFKVCNRWYSSVPGPTWANRLFFHSGTSMGTTRMPESEFELHNVLRFNQRTIYDEISDSDRKLDWHIYFHDFPQCLALENLRDNKYSDKFDRIAKLEADFQKRAEDFPAFVFIEPQYFGDGNDDHPPNNSLPAQELIARVYNALRANEELWNESLLIITYDEHGGFYDHREPPDAVPPGGPCVTTTPDYPYDRLGVRVPALLISPWVTPGVFSTQLDHTSVGKYLCEKWGLTPLGDRMEAATSFADAIESDGNPRPNAPKRIEVERVAAHAMRLPESEEMNENQRALVALADFCTPQEKLMRGPAAAGKPSPEEMAERAMQFFGRS